MFNQVKLKVMKQNMTKKTECEETKHDEKTERDGDNEKVKSETECDETK